MFGWFRNLAKRSSFDTDGRLLVDPVAPQPTASTADAAPTAGAAEAQTAPRSAARPAAPRGRHAAAPVPGIEPAVEAPTAAVTLPQTEVRANDEPALPVEPAAADETVEAAVNAPAESDPAPRPATPAADEAHAGNASVADEEPAPAPAGLLAAPSAQPAMPLSAHPNFAGLELARWESDAPQLLAPEAALSPEAQLELLKLFDDLFGPRGRYRLEWRTDREVSDDAMFAEIMTADLVRRVQNTIADVAELERPAALPELTARRERPDDELRQAS